MSKSILESGGLHTSSNIERGGTGIERGGSGIERGGTGVEKGGTGIERGGSGMAFGRRLRSIARNASLYGLLAVGFGGTGVALADGDLRLAKSSAWETIGDFPGAASMQSFADGTVKLVVTAQTQSGQPLMLLGEGKGSKNGFALRFFELVSAKELGINGSNIMSVPWGSGELTLNSCSTLSLDLFVEDFGKTQQSGSGKTQQSGSGKTQQSGSGSDDGKFADSQLYFGTVDLFATVGNACLSNDLAGIEKTQQSGSGSG